MADTYICETSYHLLITLVKVLLAPSKKYNLILLTGDTLSQDIIERLKASGLFISITKLDGLHKYDAMLDYSAPFVIRGRSLKKQIEKYVKWEYNPSDDYYLYNDVSMIGKWFNAEKIKYHLIEDGLDTLTLPSVHSNNYPESKWKRKLRMFLNAGFYSFGESKFTSSIEVNNKEGLQFDIKGKNIIEVPRKQLFEGLGTADKEKILSIYLSDSEKMDIMDKLQAATTTEDINDSNMINSVSLLLTQPLGFDKITSYEMHEEFYKDIVEKYGEGRLIIKPHPRDDFDYNKMFPDAVVIDYPFLPVEAIGFLPDININKAITWCSTSISGISFCDNKVYLGIDYITPYLKRDNFESKWHLAASLLAK